MLVVGGGGGWWWWVVVGVSGKDQYCSCSEIELRASQSLSIFVWRRHSQQTFNNISHDVAVGMWELDAFHEISNKPSDYNWNFTGFLLILFNSRRIITIRNLFTTTQSERPHITITITSQSPISLYSAGKVVKSWLRSCSCSCVLAGRCWSCVSAEVR